MLPKFIITLLASVLLVVSLAVPDVNIIVAKRTFWTNDQRLLLQPNYNLIVAFNQYEVLSGVGLNLSLADKNDASLSPQNISSQNFEINLISITGETIGSFDQDNLSGSTVVRIFNTDTETFTTSNISNLLTLASYYTKYQRGFQNVTITSRQLPQADSEITEIILVLAQRE